MSEMPKDMDENWTLILEPKKKLLDIDLRELYRYRDLVKLFISRDFVTAFKQTILGPLWYVLNPLFTTIVYSFVFGGLAKIPTDGVPQTLFYYGGSMMWSYFSGCFLNAADTFSSNSGLFSKVYFPRLAAPISKVFSSLFATGIQFATLIFFYIYFVLERAVIHPTWWAYSRYPSYLLNLLPSEPDSAWWCQLSQLSIETFVNSLFRPILWMYATPIVYPLSQVPQKYRWITEANPVSAPVEAFRLASYGVGGPSAIMLISSIVVTVVVFLFGLVLFNRNERTFVDIV